MSAETHSIHREPDYYTEEEVARLMSIPFQRLRDRVYRGTMHPPYVEVSRGDRRYPKAMYDNWLAQKKVIWPVKHEA